MKTFANKLILTLLALSFFACGTQPLESNLASSSNEQSNKFDQAEQIIAKIRNKLSAAPDNKLLMIRVDRATTILAQLRVNYIPQDKFRLCSALRVVYNAKVISIDDEIKSIVSPGALCEGEFQ